MHLRTHVDMCVPMFAYINVHLKNSLLHNNLYEDLCWSRYVGHYKRDLHFKFFTDNILLQRIELFTRWNKHRTPEVSKEQLYVITTKTQQHLILYTYNDSSVPLVPLQQICIPHK